MTAIAALLLVVAGLVVALARRLRRRRARKQHTEWVQAQQRPGQLIDLTPALERQKRDRA